MNAGMGGADAPPTAGAAGEISGDSGTDVPKDDGITFDWTQKLPGMCSPTNYLGTVTCSLQSGGITVTRIDGTLVLDLVGPSESQELKVERGSLSLLPDASGGMSLTAPVTGSASCLNDKPFKGNIPPSTFTTEEIGLLQNVALVLLCATGDNSYMGGITGSIDTDGTLNGLLALTLGSCVCESTFALRPQR